VTRVLTCLAMMSVLLLTFTVSSNGYHKAYARGDLDALGTKIRESTNNQITEELFPSVSSSPMSSGPVITLILSGFPNQTGESVTNIIYKPVEPGRYQPVNTWVGTSNIVIPGIGEGLATVQISLVKGPFVDYDYTHVDIVVFIKDLPGQTGNSFFTAQNVDRFDPETITRHLNIPGIGAGQATIPF
jgi:hypothetical protein